MLGYHERMDVLSYLNDLRDGVTPGAASDEQFVGWSHAESETQIARNAHRLNQGLELAARLEVLGWGKRGPLLQHFSKLTGRKKSVLYDRAAKAKALLELLARAGEVSGFPESSVMDVAWDDLLDAFAEALGVESAGSGRGGSGASGGLVSLWTSWLDKMDDQAGDEVASLQQLEQLLAARHEKVRLRLEAILAASDADEEPIEPERPVVERESGSPRAAPEEVVDEPTLSRERPIEVTTEAVGVREAPAEAPASSERVREPRRERRRRR